MHTDPQVPIEADISIVDEVWEWGCNMIKNILINYANSMDNNHIIPQKQKKQATLYFYMIFGKLIECRYS